MNKIWAVVLIILAILALGAGTYWYLQLRPDSDQTQATPVVSAQQTVRSPAQKADDEGTVTTVEAPPSLVEPEEPAIQIEEEPVEEIQEPAVQKEEAIIDTEDTSGEVLQVASDTVQEEEATEPEKTPPLPVTSPSTLEKPRIPAMPMPHPSAALAAVGLLKLPDQPPSVPIPYAPPPNVEAEEVPIVEQEEVAEQISEDETQETSLVTMEEEEIPILEDVEIQPEPEEVEAAIEEMDATVEDVETEETVVLTPSTVQEPSIPTSRVEFDPRPLNWSLGAAVSFVDFQWPAPVSKGFDFQLMLYKHSQQQFRYGAIFEFSKPFNASEYEFTVMGSLQWTFNEDKKLHFPVAIAIGPTLIFDGSGSPDFALTAKAMGGISYLLTEQLSFFYQAGLQARWNISDMNMTFSLEPMRVGFSFSF